MEDINFNELINKNNDNIIKIFELIKIQNWDKLKEILNSIDDDTDLNIKDFSNTYLLEFVIIFNKINIIDILLNKNIRLDILDDSSRSILYTIIKFSYTEILIKILEKDKISIGKSILEIKDLDGNIPLFYAIKFKNIKCIEIILKYTNNFYIKNNLGDNALHLAIKSENIELFYLLSNYIKDIKSRNTIGESYLHLMIKYKCYDMFKYFIKLHHTNINFIQIINICEFKYNFTILHYICYNMDLKSIEILSKFNLLKLLNGNIQDNSGHIFYHFFIMNINNMNILNDENIKNIINLNELFKNINFNINLYNIDGDTAGHLLFSNINIFSNNKLTFLVNWIIEKIDLNTQNFKGISIFYLIVKNNFWKQTMHILRKKKIDIFIIAEDSKTIFDYINQDDFEIFLEMITSSYLYQLTNKNNSLKWLEYWDNRCKKILKINELNETEIELLKDLSIDVKIKSKNYNICEDIIKNKLNKSITNFINNKNIFGISSYPISNDFIKLIYNYPNVVISTFSGDKIDILSGIIYLLNKFNKLNYYYLKTSINLFKKSNELFTCKNIKSNLFLNNNSDIVEKRFCNIENFEILWINKVLKFPVIINKNLEEIIISMVKAETDESRWFIIPIGIELDSYSHSNYLIFDIKNMQVERFEPHGAHNPNDFDYDEELLDSLLINHLNNLNLNFEYFKPRDYLQKIGFQIKEINEHDSDYIGDPNGFCALWCIWWVDLRLSNPDISRIKLFKQLNKELINGKYSYKKLIRDYSYYIIEIRDNILTKANTNINEWINDKISDKNINLLNLAIEEYL